MMRWNPKIYEFVKIWTSTKVYNNTYGIIYRIFLYKINPMGVVSSRIAERTTCLNSKSKFKILETDVKFTPKIKKFSHSVKG